MSFTQRAARLNAFAFPLVLALGCHHQDSDSSANTPDAVAEAGVANPERIMFPTRDGWTLTGDFYRGDPSTVVVLVHQLSSNRTEWAPLLTRLHSHHAMTTLAFDLRGHGQSTLGPDGNTSWTSFQNETARWAGIDADVVAAASFLRVHAHDARQWILVGSSIGSSAVLRYAGSAQAATDDNVIGVVAISPGTSYRGLDTLAPMNRYLALGHLTLLLAADGDATSATSLRQLLQLDQPHSSVNTDAALPPLHIESEIYRGTGAHGVSIGSIGVHPEMWSRIETWIRERAAHPTELPARPTSPIPSANAADASTADAPHD